MITSKDNEIIKNAAKLVKSSKHRKTARQFTAEGVRICCDGVRSGYDPALFLYTAGAKKKHPDAFDEINHVSEKAFEVSETIFERLSDTKSPQGFFCVFKILDKKKNLYRINKQGTYAGLENIQDPSNLGTILRTAEALGIDGVIMSGDCCDIYSPKVVRATLGGLFKVNAYVIDVDTAKELLKNTNSAVLDMGGSNILKENIECPILFVAGNEAHGVRDEFVSLAKKVYSLPMKNGVESLNVAVATSVAMYRTV